MDITLRKIIIYITLHSGAPPSEESQPELTPKEQEALARNELFLKRGRGYATEQSTQPQTLGYALSDSPVGLLAWIYEKLVNWTDAYPWDDDEGIPNLNEVRCSFHAID
jgi:hypothetical protein